MKIDLNFKPFINELDEFDKKVKESKHINKLTIVVNRNNGYNYIYSFDIFEDGINDEYNFYIVERIIKSILWIVGGYEILINGSHLIYERIKNAYSSFGIRSFDKEFMAKVYEKEFKVLYTDTIPKENYISKMVGGNLKGCRIGFDAGGSDRKVSAVVDGKTVYSEEVVWSPKLESDPHYQYNGIKEAIKTAASYMERVDSIGVSSAGVYIDNRIMVSSLFIKCDYDIYGDYIHNMYINIANEFNAPIVVANDGDVTALAGAMSLESTNVLGIAMGTSEAGGYINSNGGLNDWLSELAFVPVDLSDKAMEDEWSHDKGVGCKYFSQDAVIKLAEMGGYRFDNNLSLAEKLKVIQKLCEEKDPLAENIFTDIGEYLGYTIAFYNKFYDIKHVLLLGRVTSSIGGELILKRCKEIINNKFNKLNFINIQLPDEKSRRVGQAIAAASLPEDK